MRDTIRDICNLVIRDFGFGLVILTAVGTALAYQRVVVPTPDTTLTLLTLFVITALTEFKFGRSR